jgi:dTDP-4-amino-4,6-dideoxygalactose transaminase
MEIIPLMKPDIREEDIAEAVKVLRTGMLVQGERVHALETAISELIQVPHCSAVSNGTASLHLALIATGIKPGDEVIVTVPIPLIPAP